MRSIFKAAALSLVAMFAMSMAMVATASAAPHWLHCIENAAGTKYKDNNCSKAEAGGKWAWTEVTGTEKVETHGTLSLADTKVPIVGKVLVHCSGVDEGWVGPGKFDETTGIEALECTAGENCETLIGKPEPRDLPWQTELTEKRDEIRSGGKGEPGWAVTCKVLGVTKTDVCTSETGNTAVENVLTNGTSQLVLETFDKTTPKAKCTVGGAGSGEVLGTVAWLQANKQGLAVSP